MRPQLRHGRTPCRRLAGWARGLALAPLAGCLPHLGVSAQEPPFLNGIDFDEPTHALRLPPSLREISGLAFLDTRLLAHNDEDGFLVELNKEDGSVIGWTHLGPDRVLGDFEGVATLGDTLFMITSGGTLVAFQESVDDQPVSYVATLTPAGDICEIEGLASALDGRLWAVCKTNRDRALRNGLRILAMDPLEPDGPVQMVFEMTEEQLDYIGVEGLRPSAIEILPGGHTLVLSARGRLLLELDTRGRPVAWVELSKSRHPQAEGLAVSPDGALWIADEGGRGRGRLVRYGPRQGG